MSFDFYHSFRGHRYRMQFNRKIRFDGLCDPLTKKNKAIKFRRGLSGLDKLETYIHEALHACYPDLCEDAVEEGAISIALFLDRLGYDERR